MFYDDSADQIQFHQIDFHQLPRGTYEFKRDWHWAWEVWANEARIKYPEHEIGEVPHFNIIDTITKIEYHVYCNAFSILEAVPQGWRPSGF